MSDLPLRLATSISELMDRFKLRADGPYAGLSIAETSIVARIAMSARPPVQGDVAQALELPKTTMTSVVGRLEAKGLICRNRSDADGRARLLQLTETGADLANRLRRAQVDASERMLDALDVSDRETLVRLLERIAASAAEPEAE